MDPVSILIYGLVAAAGIIGAIYSTMTARRRRAELLVLASRLGFSYRPDKDAAFATG